MPVVGRVCRNMVAAWQELRSFLKEAIEHVQMHELLLELLLTSPTFLFAKTHCLLKRWFDVI
jgi:hypothetical protein